MEFSNTYYARLILNAPEKAKEYLANCQWKWIIKDETKVYSKENIDMMVEFCRSKGINIRPNFKPETIEKKYMEAKEKDL